MSRVDLNGEISERARTLLSEHFSARGRFPLLEKLSGISSPQWQNFYYKKQRLNEGMLNFLVRRLPHDEIWLLTGKKAPEQSMFPFLAPVPKERDCRTVGERLNWVIREWASPKGESLFRYLSEKDETISADDWSKVVLGLVEPTLEMVIVVCEQRPHFTQWVLLGYAGMFPQVDPTNQESLTAWKKHQEEDWESIEKAVLSQTKGFNSKTNVESTRPLRTTTVSTKNGNKKG